MKVIVTFVSIVLVERTMLTTDEVLDASVVLTACIYIYFCLSTGRGIAWPLSSHAIRRRSVLFHLRRRLLAAQSHDCSKQVVL